MVLHDDDTEALIAATRFAYGFPLVAATVPVFGNPLFEFLIKTVVVADKYQFGSAVASAVDLCGAAFASDIQDRNVPDALNALMNHGNEQCIAHLMPAIDKLCRRMGEKLPQKVEFGELLDAYPQLSKHMAIMSMTGKYKSRDSLTSRVVPGAVPSYHQKWQSHTD